MIVVLALFFGARGINAFSQSVSYHLDGSTLKIIGNGDMNNYLPTTAPWWNYRSSIEKIIIDEGITRIGDYSFLNCDILKSVIIPESVVYIGANAFRNCKELVSITIPKNVRMIGEYALWGCTNLSSIINHNPNPVSVNRVFEAKNQKACTLKVPDSCVSRYQRVEIWKDFQVKPLSGESSVFAATKPVQPFGDTSWNGLYVVVIASYSSKLDADRHGKKLGYDYKVIPATVNGINWYRVSVGSCNDKKDADRLVREWNEKPGIKEVIHYKKWW